MSFCAHLLDHVHPGNHLTEHGVLAIECRVRSWSGPRTSVNRPDTGRRRAPSPPRRPCADERGDLRDANGSPAAGPAPEHFFGHVACIRVAELDDETRPRPDGCAGRCRSCASPAPGCAPRSWALPSDRSRTRRRPSRCRRRSPDRRPAKWAQRCGSLWLARLEAGRFRRRGLRRLPVVRLLRRRCRRGRAALSIQVRSANNEAMTTNRCSQPGAPDHNSSHFVHPHGWSKRTQPTSGGQACPIRNRAYLGRQRRAPCHPAYQSHPNSWAVGCDRAIPAARIHGPADVLSPRHEIQIDERPPTRVRGSIQRLLGFVRRVVRTQPSRFEIRCTCVSTQMFCALLNARISTRFAVFRPTPGSATSSSIVDGTRPPNVASASRSTPSRGAPCSDRS